MVTVHAPAWTRVVVCAGTPNNASMVTVYAPAWTTVVVCAGTPHNKLRVTIHAPAWTKVVVCVGTPSVTICDVYRRRTRVSRRPLCCAPARNVYCDTHVSWHRLLSRGGVDRYVVHRHVMCVVIRAYLDTRFFPVGGERKGGTRRHAGASDEACTGIHVTQLLLHTGARHRMRQNISWVCATRHVHAYWNGRGGSVRFVIPVCGMCHE